MSKETNKRAVKKYQKTHYIRTSLFLNKGTDADVIEWLNEVSKRQSKRGYILNLIRLDMETENED